LKNTDVDVCLSFDYVWLLGKWKIKKNKINIWSLMF